MSRKKILVLGSAGMMGSLFIRHGCYDRIHHDRYEFFSVDKLATSSMMNNIYQHKLHEFFIGDICDEHIMERIFEYVKPDIVVHFAAESSVDKSIGDPNLFVKSNVLGTQILVNLSIKHQVERFYYTSTDEVLGALKEDDAPWTEDAPLNPRNPYSASKAAGEMIVRAAGNTYGLPFIISRSCNNFSERQTSDKLIPRTIKCLFKGKKIPIYGKGLQMREWIHTKDNNHAIFTLLQKGMLGETYHIGSGQELRNIDVVREVCIVLEKDPNEHIEFIEDPRPGHDFRYALNSGKLRALGWNPIYKTFQDGIRATIDWYSSNRYFLK